MASRVESRPGPVGSRDVHCSRSPKQAVSGEPDYAVQRLVLLRTPSTRCIALPFPQGANPAGHTRPVVAALKPGNPFPAPFVPAPHRQSRPPPDRAALFCMTVLPTVARGYIRVWARILTRLRLSSPYRTRKSIRYPPNTGIWPSVHDALMSCRQTCPNPPTTRRQPAAARGGLGHGTGYRNASVGRRPMRPQRG